MMHGLTNLKYNIMTDSHTELKKINTSQCGVPDVSRNKRKSDFDCYFLGNVKEIKGKQNLTLNLGF
jgi:hypothetical protein